MYITVALTCTFSLTNKIGHLLICLLTIRIVSCILSSFKHNEFRLGSSTTTLLTFGLNNFLSGAGAHPVQSCAS